MKKVFERYVKDNVNRIGYKQKIAILIIFTLLVIAGHIMNLIRLNGASDGKPKLPYHQQLPVPPDISLPDSLDVDLIRIYREMKRKQDSINKNKSK